MCAFYYCGVLISKNVGICFDFLLSNVDSDQQPQPNHTLYVLNGKKAICMYRGL